MKKRYTALALATTLSFAWIFNTAESVKAFLAATPAWNSLSIRMAETHKVSMINESSTGYIYIGDSRFAGMQAVMPENENTFVVAEVGKGVSWFCSAGYEAIQKIRKENDYEDWVYILNLGVNDIGNVERWAG